MPNLLSLPPDVEYMLAYVKFPDVGTFEVRSPLYLVSVSSISGKLILVTMFI